MLFLSNSNNTLYAENKCRLLLFLRIDAQSLSHIIFTDDTILTFPIMHQNLNITLIRNRIFRISNQIYVNRCLAQKTGGMKNSFPPDLLLTLSLQFVLIMVHLFIRCFKYARHVAFSVVPRHSAGNDDASCLFGLGIMRCHFFDKLINT